MHHVTHRASNEGKSLLSFFFNINNKILDKASRLEETLLMLQVLGTEWLIIIISGLGSKTAGHFWTSTF